MTVDELRKFLKGLPSDMPVMRGDRDYVAVEAGSAYTSSASWVPDRSKAGRSLEPAWPPSDARPVPVLIID